MRFPIVRLNPNHTRVDSCPKPARAGPRGACTVFIDFGGNVCAHFGVMAAIVQHELITISGGHTMRLAVEIVVTLFLTVCVGASSVAFAAPKPGHSAEGLSCSFSVPQNASPAQRCAAIRRQCGGKFYANYCGNKLVAD